MSRSWLVVLLVGAATVNAYDGVVDFRRKGLFLQTRLEFPQPVKDKFHTTSELYEKLTALASNCPEMTIDEKAGDGAYTNKVVTLKHTNQNPNPKKLLVNFNMHGRELITGETSLALAKAVCNTDNRASKFTRDEALNILKDTTIVYVPVLNKAGRQKAENPADHSCTDQRKNKALVDPNRNFAFQWAADAGLQNSETYPGSASMTEPEVKYMNMLADEHKPNAYLDVHAGEDAMGWPFGYDETVVIPNEASYQAITSAVNAEVWPTDNRWSGRLAAMGGVTAYRSSGCACDFFSQKSYNGEKVLAMTWEIWSETKSRASASKTDKAQVAAQQAVVPENLKVLSMLEEDEAVDDAASKDQSLEKQTNHIAQEESLAATDRTAQSIVAEPPMGKNALMPQQPQAINLAQASVNDLAGDDCFAYFNPTTPEKYDLTVKNWADAILIYARELKSL